MEPQIVSLSLSSQDFIDPKFAARRALTEAVTGYLTVCKDLASATEHATQTTSSIDTGARKRAYQRLTELGDQVRLAQRGLATAARRARRVLTPAEIELIAKTLDKRDTTDSAPVLIKEALLPR